MTAWKKAGLPQKGKDMEPGEYESESEDEWGCNCQSCRDLLVREKRLRNDVEADLIPDSRSSIVAQQITNPLLIEEILEQVLGHLNGSWDLVTCYDVCSLWRQVATPIIIRTQSVRPPLLVKKDLTDADGSTYLASIRQAPILKATKFIFKDVDLRAPTIQALMRENGQDMEQLELSYSYDACVKGRREKQAVRAMAEMLKDLTPNLRTLIITQLPPHLHKVDWFSQQPSSAIGPQLSLTKIVFSFAFVKNALERNYHSIYYSSDFLQGLFIRCPHLRELVIDRCPPDDCSNHGQYTVLLALKNTNRLRQLTKIELDCADFFSLQILTIWLSPHQLHSLSIFGLAHADIFLPLYPLGTLEYRLLQGIIVQQADSLQYLKMPVHFDNPLILPPMPNLLAPVTRIIRIK